MNKDNAKDFLPLVQALADGKTIQFKSTRHNYWMDASTPTFVEPASWYRIKPEPIELELWYNDANGDTCAVSPKDKEQDWVNVGYRKIKMREIL